MERVDQTADASALIVGEIELTVDEKISGADNDVIFQTHRHPAASPGAIQPKLEGVGHSKVGQTRVHQEAECSADHPPLPYDRTAVSLEAVRGCTERGTDKHVTPADKQKPPHRVLPSSRAVCMKGHRRYCDEA